MRFHTQNLSYDRLPTWRHGRGWLGRLHAEWHLFHDPGLRSLSCWCWGFSAYLPWFGLHLERGEKSRDWRVAWHGGSLWIDHPWVRENEWRSADPWWNKTITLHVVNWLIGSARYAETKGEPRDVFVPMPEGSYRAVATPSTQVWMRRWYWPAKRRDSVWLDIPGGIPCSGKGENSWDCGDDGLFGCGGDNVEGAIARAVESSLRSRRRHGYDSRGTGRVPALVVNATEPTP